MSNVPESDSSVEAPVKVKYVLPTRERTYGRGTVRLRPHSLSLSHLPRDHTSVRSTRPHSRTPQFG